MSNRIYKEVRAFRSVARRRYYLAIFNNQGGTYMASLVLWEVSRKQNYIFSSNKLKENIGGSIIIEKIIEELPKSIKSTYQSNLVYNGGGSSLYEFETNQQAKTFVKDVSRRVLKTYPGIELFMTIVDYNKRDQKITDVIGKAYRKLEAKKSSRRNSGEQISFGIEKTCDSTGLPAVEPRNDFGEKRYVSDVIDIKIKESNNREKKFNKLLLGHEMIKGTRELSKNDKNYMAVVHIDGNRMGQKFDQLSSYFTYEEGSYEETNKSYIEALKIFSRNIQLAYEEAFMEMSKAIESNKDILAEDTNIDKGKFPLIPIIVAGDDITYITHGKIGIETARIFLESLYNKEIEIYNGQMTRLNACAGVAIVRTSYPFSKAYELAENLCENAKTILRKEYPDNDYSLIDWHIEQGDLLGPISEMRNRYYKTIEDNKKLYMRPLYLNNDYEGQWRNYSNFQKAYDNITSRKIFGKAIARNKLKELREILKKGEKATELFLRSNRLENYFSRFEDTTGDYCFHEDRCMYFDALEVLDMYIFLKKKVKESDQI